MKEMVGLAFLVLAAGCQTNLKTLDLAPASITPHVAVIEGAKQCAPGAHPNPLPPLASTKFAPVGAAEVVGFWNTYDQSGSWPLPCDRYRDAYFRLGFEFDLGLFDEIVDAVALVLVQKSLTRNNDVEAVDTPPVSYATTIGVAAAPIQQFFWQLKNGPDVAVVEEVDVPDAGPGDPFDTGIDPPVLNLNLTHFVKKMIGNQLPTRTFVVGGPHPVTGAPNQVFFDNDARFSWYEVRRLRVLYDPARNPRAPQ